LLSAPPPPRNCCLVMVSLKSLLFNNNNKRCSNVCLCRCSVLTLFFCTTLWWSTTFRTNSHSSFDFNFFAVNPWELYTQGYRNNNNNISVGNSASGRSLENSLLPPVEPAESQQAASSPSFSASFEMLFCAANIAQWQSTDSCDTRQAGVRNTRHVSCCSTCLADIGLNRYTHALSCCWLHKINFKNWTSVKDFSVRV